MSNFTKWLIAIISFFLLLVLILEVFLSTKEVIQEKNYRKLHCFYEDFLFLCPNQEFVFIRKDQASWKITTNTFGERITPRTKTKEEYPEEIWFIGDSISYGYLVNDEETTPYLLDQNQKIPVRNLGVDSLGTLGILARLEKALKDHQQTIVHSLFWIYNSSDFDDDVWFQHRQSQVFKKKLYFLHYELSKRSSIYTFLLMKRKTTFNVIPEVNVNPEILDFAHITFQNISSFVAWISTQSRIKEFFVIIYPGMNVQTRTADVESPITKNVVAFLQNQGVKIIDLRDEFAKSREFPYFTLSLMVIPVQLATKSFREA